MLFMHMKPSVRKTTIAFKQKKFTPGKDDKALYDIHTNASIVEETSSNQKKS